MFLIQGRVLISWSRRLWLISALLRIFRLEFELSAKVSVSHLRREKKREKKKI